MKVIFLDVDGVLNCEYTKEKIDDILFVMDSKIELLKTIIDQTGAKVVLSSTWRQGWLDMEHGINSREVCHFLALQEKLTEHGIELLFRTPIHTIDDRGAEIEEWLKTRNGEPIESYVLLDDMNGRYLRPHSNRLVRTSFQKGLLPKHVKLAGRLLEQPRER